MAERIIIPRMGQTMTEGTVAKWYVSDGASVSAGDDIYELEYDKSSATIQAKTAGTVRLLCSEGDVISLGQAVAVVLAEGERLEDVNVAGEHQVANAAPAGDAAPPLLMSSTADLYRIRLPSRITSRRISFPSPGFPWAPAAA